MMIKGTFNRNEDSLANVKEALGKAAAEMVEDGMVVGLGTGSTAAYFIQSLIQRSQNGLKISTVATSENSRLQAMQGGLVVLDPNDVSKIDITVDGADEVDPKKRLIKGRGGALLREKIIAYSSDKLVVIVDEQKIVENLGKGVLPIEITTFGYKLTIKNLEKLDLKGSIRYQNNQPFVTDNGNLIFDAIITKLLVDPERIDQEIRKIPGVVETGFFFHLADIIMIGYQNAPIEIRT